MGKLERKNHKVFGINATESKVGQFGSANAITKIATKDIEKIQELEAWEQGWEAGAVGDNRYPTQQERTGVDYEHSYQIGYLLQEGIPEWNALTTYSKGSIVKQLTGDDVVLYQSLIDDNMNNVLTDTVAWKKLSLGGGSGLEICDIGISLYVDESKGLRRCLNGQIVGINNNTKVFLVRLQKIIASCPSLEDTEENWQAKKALSPYGQVGTFVLNYASDGVTVESVRIPRIVNIQGLLDLQNLGMTVSAGLPTHTHTRGTMDIKGSIELPKRSDKDMLYNQSGAFYQTSIYQNRGDGQIANANDNWTVGLGFQASRSWTGSTSAPNNSIYGNSTTVQPEAIQYPYFIQIATGQETKADIKNELELNNPYSFGDSKYSPLALNNASWLKSEGQWNSKAIYPDCYEWVLQNANNSVDGFKKVSDTYTDYDFVINTADEKFRLPLLNGSEDLPGDEIYTYDLPTTNGQKYTALYNGTVEVKGTTTATNQYMQVKNNTSGVHNESRNPISNNYIMETVEVKRGDEFQVTGSVIGNVTSLTLSKHQGNGNLYYYVGNTIQNADLIDIGRVTESLTTKVDTDLSNLPTSSKQEITGWAFPSNKYIDLTLNASGSTYTAPADGWVYLSMYPTSVGGWSNVYIDERHDIPSRGVSEGLGPEWFVTHLCPVNKGKKFIVGYGISKCISFRFYYCISSVPVA